MDNNSAFKNKFNALKTGTVKFFKKNGYYVLAFVCLGLAGAAAIITLNSPNSKDEAQLPASTDDNEASSSMDETLKMLTPMPTATVTPAIIPEFTPVPTAKPTAKSIAPKAAAPVDGKIMRGFAMDDLIYSKTLNQWMTHPGVDIACKQNSQVLAVLPGTVEEVYEDDMYGITVVVSHSSKQSSVYSNLSEKPPVEAGDKVNAGDTIGYVGNTAIGESSDVSHLHFEFKVNSKAVDPVKYVLFVKGE